MTGDRFQHLLNLAPSTVTVSDAPSWSALVRKSTLAVIAIAAVSLLVALAASFRLAQSANWSGSTVVRWLPWVIPFGAGSYLLRFLRWHTLVRQLAPGLHIASSLRIYLAGFAMGLTPGRLGEFFKFSLLRSATAIPEAESAPIFPLERATEAASFAGLATVGAVAGHLSPVRLGLGAVIAILAIPGLAVLALLIGRLRGRHDQQDIGAESIVSLLGRGVQSIAGPGPLTVALTCALAARCCDTAMFWAATRAAGLQVPLAGSALAYGLAGLTGGLSLLPAGVGAVEASLVATVSGLGADPAAALVAALLARSTTLWAWIPAGLWFAYRQSSPQRGNRAAATMSDDGSGCAA